MDIQWLVAAAEPKDHGLPDPAAHTLDLWLDFAASHRATWRTWIRNAVQSSATRDHDLLESSVLEEFERVGCHFECESCSRVFTSLRGLNSHKAKEHAYRHPSRALVAGSVCPSCLMDFWSRPRLIHHLRLAHGQKCLRALSVWRRPLDAADQVELDQADERFRVQQRRLGRAMLWADKPAFRRPGPLPSRSIRELGDLEPQGRPSAQPPVYDDELLLLELLD